MRPKAGLLGLLLALAGTGCDRAAEPVRLDPLPGALKDLDAKDAQARRAAVQVVAKAGVRALDALPRLIALLQDADPVVRYWSATAIRHMGPAAASAVPALVRAMSDDVPSVRAAATKALVPVGARLAQTSEALNRALQDPDITVRRYALDTIRVLDPGTKRDASAILRGDLVAADPVPAEGSTPSGPPPVRVGEHFRHFGEKPSSELPGSWPSHLGPGRDGISRETTPLLDRLPPDGPPILWKTPLRSIGYGSAVVHHGCVYVFDYDPDLKAEMLRCFSLSEGLEIWRRWHTVSVRNLHGFTHSTPVVGDDGVVVVGRDGTVLCADPDGGGLRWGLSLSERFDDVKRNVIEVQSPLLDGRTVVLAAGGREHFIVGLDALTGELLWKTPRPDGAGASLSSVTRVTHGGRPMYVYIASRGVLAVSAEPETLGRQLWCTPFGNEYAVPGPIPISDALLYLTAGYSQGSELLRIGRTDGGVSAEVVWKRSTREGFSSDAHGPILFQGRLFGILPQVGGRLRRQFACVDPTSGEVSWTSGSERRFSDYGPVLLADGKFYVFSNGEIVVLRATPERYEEISRAKLDLFRDWLQMPALVGGRLILRTETHLVCLDLRRKD